MVERCTSEKSSCNAFADITKVFVTRSFVPRCFFTGGRTCLLSIVSIAERKISWGARAKSDESASFTSISGVSASLSSSIVSFFGSVSVCIDAFLNRPRMFSVRAAREHE